MLRACKLKNTVDYKNTANKRGETGEAARTGHVDDCPGPIKHMDRSLE